MVTLIEKMKGTGTSHCRYRTLSNNAGKCVKDNNQIQQVQNDQALRLVSQQSHFANACVQEIPRKEVMILFKTRKLMIHNQRKLS